MSTHNRKRLKLRVHEGREKLNQIQFDFLLPLINSRWIITVPERERDWPTRASVISVSLMRDTYLMSNLRSPLRRFEQEEEEVSIKFDEIARWCPLKIHNMHNFYWRIVLLLEVVVVMIVKKVKNDDDLNVGRDFVFANIERECVFHINRFVTLSFSSIHLNFLTLMFFCMLCF